MKRWISWLLLVALIVSFLGLCPPMKTDAASVRNRKIVSVVFDDSGSMAGEKWEYTSYAMQCFAAMLNKEDQLYITYMSTYMLGSSSVDTNNRANSVKNIRDHQGGGGTPVQAVDTAFSTLQSANDTNPNTQYWLIVMTDGIMEGAEKKVNGVAEKTMPNGTKPHIVYLTLCDPDGSLTPSFNKSNIENRSAKTADEIIGVISDVACNISGRYPVAPEDIKVINDTTIEVTSDLPLINIGILSQRSKAQVSSATDQEGTAFKNEGNVPVSAPGLYPGALSADAVKALNGNVALFSAASGNIPAGTYTITFSEPVAKDDLVVMFEPAFELRLEMFINGASVTDPSQLTEGAVVDVEAALYEVGTDTKIALSMLPSGYKTSISCAENQKIVASDNSLKLTGLKLSAVETEITATLDIPGFFTTTDVMRFTPQRIVLSDMTAELHYDGSERLPDENGNPDPENVVYIDRLEDNETGIAFQMEIDGEPISRDKALAVQSLFEERLNTEFPNYDVSVSTDGKLIVTPRKVWWMKLTGDLIYSWIYGGEKTISCTYDGFTASGTLNFKLADPKAAIPGIIIRIGILLAIIYMLLWIFVKHHFCKPVKIRLYRCTDSADEYEPVAGSLKRIHWFSSSDPFNYFGLLGMRKRLNGSKFYVRSTAGDSYRVDGVKGMRVSDSIPYPGLGTPCCEDRFYEFDSTVYIWDGANTYYQITVG